MTETLLPSDYPDRFSTWTRLMDEGNKVAADTFYFENLMPAILPLMRANKSLDKNQRMSQIARQHRR